MQRAVGAQTGAPAISSRECFQNAVRSAFTSQKMPGLLAKINREDLAILSNLVQRGTVIPVVDRTYSCAKSQKLFVMSSPAKFTAKS